MIGTINAPPEIAVEDGSDNRPFKQMIKSETDERFSLRFKI
jgi:hypothetical protein